MSGWFWVMIAVYLATLIGVGLHSWRKTKSAEDYIMAGSKIGVMVGMLTFAATLFSTFTLLGMPKYFYAHGVGAWIFLAIPDAAMFFLVLWFGLHLRRVAAKHDYQGVGGLMSQCYGSPLAGIVYFMGVFFFLVPYVAIQIRGIATFLTEVSDILPMWGWAVGIICVMLMYSEVGGLRAIIHCDAIQGTILLIVIWIIALGCLSSLGGVSAMFDQVEAKNPALLSTPGPEGKFTPQFLIASFFAILLIPVTQPQVTTRLIIIKDKKTMCHMAVGLSVFTMLILIPTIIIGLYGSLKYADSTPQEFIAGVLLHEQPSLISAMVLVGLLAAATSTADSQLFALGSELRSLLVLRGTSPLAYTRIAIFCFGGAALAFALRSSDKFVDLARMSFAGTSLLAPMIFTGIFAKRKPGAEIPIVTGVALVVFLMSLFKVIPGIIGGMRLDLGLLIVLSLTAIVSAFARKGRLQGTN